MYQKWLFPCLNTLLCKPRFVGILYPLFCNYMNEMRLVCFQFFKKHSFVCLFGELWFVWTPAGEQTRIGIHSLDLVCSAGGWYSWHHVSVLFVSIHKLVLSYFHLSLWLGVSLDKLRSFICRGTISSFFWFCGRKTILFILLSVFNSI